MDFWSAKESPLNVKVKLGRGFVVASPGVLVVWTRGTILYKGQYHIFPVVRMSNGEVYERRESVIRAQKGGSRLFLRISGRSQGGFQTDKRMVVKVFTSSSDEFFIEGKGPVALWEFRR